MSNDFLTYRQVRLASGQKPWSEDMKKTYSDIDSSRESIAVFVAQLEEHLRNKWSQETPNYREQPGYVEEMKEVRKLKRLEEDLYKTLYRVRKF